MNLFQANYQYCFNLIRYINSSDLVLLQRSESSVERLPIFIEDYFLSSFQWQFLNFLTLHKASGLSYDLLAFNFEGIISKLRNYALNSMKFDEQIDLWRDLKSYYLSKLLLAVATFFQMSLALARTSSIQESESEAEIEPVAGVKD